MDLEPRIARISPRSIGEELRPNLELIACEVGGLHRCRIRLELDSIEPLLGETTWSRRANQYQGFHRDKTIETIWARTRCQRASSSDN